MSFTAVILKLPFSALSTVRWGEGRRNAPRKGEWTLSTPVFCPLRSYAHRSRRLRAGSRWAMGTFPLKTIHSQEWGIPHLRVRKCWSAAVLRRSTSRRMDWMPRQGDTRAGRLQPRWWCSGPLRVKFHNCFLPTASHTCWKRTWL